MYVEATN